MRDRIQVAVFLSVLVLPAVGLVFGWNDPSLVKAENRSPGALPGLPRDWAGLVAFPGRFDAWFRDHFGFRSHLIRVAKRAEPKFAGHGFDHIGVFAGREGWLYWGGLSDLDSSYCVRAEEHARAWRRLAESRRRWFAERGLRFVWAVAPNKHTVYPQFLPRDVRACDLQALPRALGEGAAVLLDLRPALRERAAEGRLFHLKDSHWNQLGAFYGARRIAEHVLRDPPSWRIEDFEITVREGVAGGNLANYFAVHGETHFEDVIVLRSRGALSAHPVEGSPAPDPDRHSRRQKRIVLETDHPELPSAVIFHDSFGYTAMPFLAESFRRAVFLHSGGELDGEAIEAERPDVVILLSVETRFLTPPPERGLGAAREK